MVFARIKTLLPVLLHSSFLWWYEIIQSTELQWIEWHRHWSLKPRTNGWLRCPLTYQSQCWIQRSPSILQSPPITGPSWLAYPELSSPRASLTPVPLAPTELSLLTQVPPLGWQLLSLLSSPISSHGLAQGYVHSGLSQMALPLAMLSHIFIIINFLLRHT